MPETKRIANSTSRSTPATMTGDIGIAPVLRGDLLRDLAEFHIGRLLLAAIGLAYGVRGRSARPDRSLPLQCPRGIGPTLVAAN